MHRKYAPKNELLAQHKTKIYSKKNVRKKIIHVLLEKRYHDKQMKQISRMIIRKEKYNVFNKRKLK